MYVLAGAAQGAARLAARVGIHGAVVARGARGAAAEGEDARVGPLDAAEGPGPRALVVPPEPRRGFVVAVHDVVAVQVEHGRELREHPRQRYVRQRLLVVAAADVAVRAGEPDLAQTLRVVDWLAGTQDGSEEVNGVASGGEVGWGETVIYGVMMGKG